MADLEWADEFRQWRDRMRLTQEQAALTLGVSSKTVKNWEQGWTAPDMPELVRIAMTCRERHGRLAQHGT